MDITLLGHSSFRIKGKQAIVVTDPFDSEMVGIKFPKNLETDIVTVSHGHEDHSAVSQLSGTPFVISVPGEYEVKGVGIVGISSFHDNEKGKERGANTMYRIEIDGISIVHLGDLGHTLNSAQVDELGNVDILFVPVGGVYTIDPSTAVTIVNEVEPSVVIPMHYGRPELNKKNFESLATVEQFLKEMGKPDIIAQPKYSVTKDKLPAEMQVVVLS